MLVSVKNFEEKQGQPISIELQMIKNVYIIMKTLLKNIEKQRDQCWLLFKLSFMKPLLAQFTLEPLLISFVSFFAVATHLINLIA